MNSTPATAARCQVSRFTMGLRYGQEEVTPLVKNTTTITSPTTPVVNTIPTVAAPHQAVHCMMGLDYMQKELIHLFNTILCIKPIGPIEWEEVEKEHAKVHDGQDIDSLKHKYILTHCKTIPTGDPEYHVDVCLTK